MGDIAQRGNKLTRGRGPHGHAHQPHLSVHAKGGRIGRPSKRKDFKTHGRDVPTMAAKGGRIGLKHGGKPWGTGPKPGTHDYLMQELHKPRKRKAIGGAATIGKTVKKFAKQYHKKKKLAEDTKKGKFPETESLTHQKGPYVGDVGSEKRVKKAKGGKTDKKWIQKAVNPKHKGYCTPMTKKTCTPRRKALARTFKKKAKTGW